MATYQPAPARRGSIVGPLLLLALGVVLLIHNLRPDLSLWRLLQYWPYLLIIWGAGRLLEYLLGRWTGRPIARTLTPGEVVLAVLICLLGSQWPAIRGRTWPFGIGPRRGIELFGEPYRFDLRLEHRVPPNAEIVIQNLHGNIRVTGGETGRMLLTGQKTVRALGQSDADSADRATSVEFTAQDGRLYVNTSQDRAPGRQHVSADLDVELPRTASVTIEGRSGNIEVRGVGGAVRVNSGNAEVRLASLGSDAGINVRRSDEIQVSGVLGNLEISGRGRNIRLSGIGGQASINGAFSGEIQLQNIAHGLRYTSSQTNLSLEKLTGEMRLDLRSITLRGADGPIRFESRNKDIRIEDFSHDVEAKNRRGHIELTPRAGALGAIRVETSTGDIRLTLPPGASFSLEGATRHGRVINGLGGSIQIDSQGQATRVRGGPGGPLIHLNAERGDLILRRPD
jgi:DUF4097 and DUF4098 domain-containing protein YvlB